MKEHILIIVLCFIGTCVQGQVNSDTDTKERKPIQQPNKSVSKLSATSVNKRNIESTDSLSMVNIKQRSSQVKAISINQSAGAPPTSSRKREPKLSRLAKRED